MVEYKVITNVNAIVEKANRYGMPVRDFKLIRKLARHIYLCGRYAYIHRGTEKSKYWSMIADNYSKRYRKLISQYGYRMSYRGLQPVMVDKNGNRINPAN
jgi:hypothetical protein